MDLRGSTVTLNSGVNSVMEGYGSVKEPESLLSLSLERKRRNQSDVRLSRVLVWSVLPRDPDQLSKEMRV